MSAKRKGSEYWIVTRFNFHEHDSAEAATTECARLQAANPDEKFRVIRCKRNPKASPDKIALGKQMMALSPVLDSAKAFLDWLDGADDLGDDAASALEKSLLDNLRAAVANAKKAPHEQA